MERTEQRGFTLIELMIAIAIIGILAAIAYPNYQAYIIKSNRTSAQAQMMDIANREQQFLLANRAYADKDDLEASGYRLPDDLARRYDYDVEVGEDTVPSFVITFTAKGPQTDDGDLELTSEGLKSPVEKW